MSADRLMAYISAWGSGLNFALGFWLLDLDEPLSAVLHFVFAVSCLVFTGIIHRVAEARR